MSGNSRIPEDLRRAASRSAIKELLRIVVPMALIVTAPFLLIIAGMVVLTAILPSGKW